MLTLFHMPQPSHCSGKDPKGPKRMKYYLYSFNSKYCASWTNETWRSIVKIMLKYTVINLIHLLCMNWSCPILQGSANSPRQLILSFKYVTILEEWLLYVIPYHHSKYGSISWVLQLLERHEQVEACYLSAVCCSRCEGASIPSEPVWSESYHFT